MQRHDVDTLVDRFVTTVNRAARQRIREEDIPLQLRRGGARYGLYYSWNIQRFDSITWIETIEKELPARFPPCYRSLVTRYIFPAFELPPLLLLGNTGHALYNEMSYVIFRDQGVSAGLLEGGYLQFARPQLGDSDPVCFDLKRRNADGEYPVVQISYQQALVNQRPTIIREVAGSLGQLMQRYVAASAGSSRLDDDRAVP